MSGQRWVGTVAGRERTIEVVAQGGNVWKVRVDGGPERFVDALPLGNGAMHLVDGAGSFDIRTEVDGDVVTASIGDASLSVELVDERRRKLALTRGAHAATGPVVMKSPMPGKVVKILVAVGAEVTEGQGVMVLEAMKMENELRAPRAGTVKELFVAEGSTVEGKAVLLSIG